MERSRAIAETASLVRKFLGDGFAAPAGASRAASGRESPAGAEGDDLESLTGWIARCSRCTLSETRTLTVPGEGAKPTKVLVVGEGPGAEEDAAGRPFVGKAGKYLDKWLGAIELSRDTNCYIANVVKCRPPGNRDPEPAEIRSCLPYLEQQIRILAPSAILTLGRFAARTLTGQEGSMRSFRGRLHRYLDVPLVATYHPSAVLRDQSLRAPVWEDLKVLRDILSEAE